MLMTNSNENLEALWLRMELDQVELFARAGYDVERHGDAVYVLDRSLPSDLRLLMAYRVTNGMFSLMGSNLQGYASQGVRDEDLRRMLA